MRGHFEDDGPKVYGTCSEILAAPRSICIVLAVQKTCAAFRLVLKQPGLESTRVEKGQQPYVKYSFLFGATELSNSQGYLGKEPEKKHRNVDLWFLGEKAEHFILVVHFLVNRKECCEVEEQVAYAKRRFYTRRLMSRAFHHCKES